MGHYGNSFLRNNNSFVSNYRYSFVEDLCSKSLSTFKIHKTCFKINKKCDILEKLLEVWNFFLIFATIICVS